MGQVTLRRPISHIGPLQIGIIVLAVTTGLVHLYRGLSMSLLAGPRPGGRFRPPANFTGAPPHHFAGPPPGGGFSLMMHLPLPLTTLFYLNFVGYIVLATALYLPLLTRYQRIIRWILIGYVALTIIAWLLITGAQPNILAYIDKPIEVALIILLVLDDRRAAHQRAMYRG